MPRNDNIIDFDNYLRAKGRSRRLLPFELANASIEVKGFFALVATGQFTCFQLTHLASRLLSPLAAKLTREVLQQSRHAPDDGID